MIGGVSVSNIIVVFPRTEDVKNIKNLLIRHGFEVLAACTSGAQVLNHADHMSDGIVICGYRLADMLYSELREELPANFEMLLVASDPGTGELRKHRSGVCRHASQSTGAAGHAEPDDRAGVTEQKEAHDRAPQAFRKGESRDRKGEKNF